MLWAALLLPRLGLDALVRHAPAADESLQRLALISRDQARPLIVDAMPHAREAGVRRGQTLAAALALFPPLKTTLHDPAQEQRLRELLAGWAYGYSSHVSLREADAILIEVGGSLSLFGPWPKLERRWRAELTELGITHRLAVAPTALGALALAHAQDGVLIANHAVLRQALDALPIAHAQFPALLHSI
jgi:protein ImuB